MFFLYILWSRSTNKFYIGQTKDLNRRLIYHNSGYNKSTKAGGNWELVYAENFNTHNEAVKREKELKRKKSRDYIQRLVKNRECPE